MKENLKIFFKFQKISDITELIKQELQLKIWKDRNYKNEKYYHWNISNIKIHPGQMGNMT
jgi:negative regulator of genetic competence, sporulation and motility